MQNMVNKPAGGVWTLTIRDDGSGLSGRLNSWSLNFRVQESPPSSGSCPIVAKAADVPLVIPGLGEASSRITIPPDAGTIVDANLIFRFTNTCDTLGMDLRAPDGKVITVKNPGVACFESARQGLSINPLIAEFLTGRPAGGTWTLSTTNVGAAFSGTLDSWSLTLQVTGAAGQCSSLDDNFGDNTLNPALWAVRDPPAVGTQGLVAETNQRLEITNNAAGQSGAGIASHWFLTGDFDVQVDYHLLNWSASSGHSVQLRALDLPSGSLGGAAISRHSSRPGGEQYVAAFGNSIVSIPTSDSSGRLRLVRSGTALGAFAYDGTRWFPVMVIGSGTSTTATRISLEAGSNDPLSPGGVVIALDNFRINAGVP